MKLQNNVKKTDKKIKTFSKLKQNNRLLTQNLPLNYVKKILKIIYVFFLNNKKILLINASAKLTQQTLFSNNIRHCNDLTMKNMCKCLIENNLIVIFDYDKKKTNKQGLKNLLKTSSNLKSVVLVAPSNLHIERILFETLVCKMLRSKKLKIKENVSKKHV